MSLALVLDSLQAYSQTKKSSCQNADNKCLLAGSVIKIRKYLPLIFSAAASDSTQMTFCSWDFQTLLSSELKLRSSQYEPTDSEKLAQCLNDHDWVDT